MITLCLWQFFWIVSNFLNSWRICIHPSHYYTLAFHQLLEWTVMLTIFEFFVHVFWMVLANLLIILSRHKMLTISLISMFLRASERSLMNAHSSSLSLTMVCFLVLMCFLTIGMTIVKGAWSDMSLHLEWIEWLSISLDPQCKNIRSMTKLESWMLSEYLVRTWLVGRNSPRLKKSAIIKRSSLIEEWCGKKGSHRLLQILKSPVIIKRFWILTLVSLRYFKAKWEELE